MTTTNPTAPTNNNTPATHKTHASRNPDLDAGWIYDLGYAQGVREAIATFQIAAATGNARPTRP
jgi:hypothetical protein